MFSAWKWLTAVCLMALGGSCGAQSPPLILFPLTNSWRYQQTTNFDGVNWTAPAFDDSAWPSGPGLLYVETSPFVTPRNTPLVLGRNTYYFRTHFQFTNGASGASLVFSNLIDDGAVIYLNGTEVQRVRMLASPTPIVYGTFASASPLPIGDAERYDVFALTGDILTNLLNGDNVLAVEVHQRTAGDTDIVWGAALSALPYTGAMTFVTHPTYVSVLDGRPATFSAKAVSDPDPAYQWFKDGAAIPSATNRVYSLAAAYPSHAGTYYLQASNANGTLASSNAALTVVGDFDPPIPLSATGAKDLVTIAIAFNEAPSPASAMGANHFSVLPDGPGSAPAQVLSAMLTNQTNIVLVTTPRTPRTDYVVHIEGVHDFSSRSNSLTTDLPLRSVVDLVNIDAATTWHLDDSGTEPSANWAQPGFDDSSWSNGLAVFYAGLLPGQLPALVRTSLALTNRFDTNRVLTYYFRLSWDFPGEPATASFRLRYIVDDGAVFHLNGSEIHSVRVPATRPLFSTNLATTTIGIPIYEPATNQPGITLSNSSLRSGQNLLAVEVHQGSLTVPDIAFAAALEATIERFATPVRLAVPGNLAEQDGIVSNACMASIEAALPADLLVSLASSAPGSVAVPASVVIPAGGTNVAFNLAIIDDNLLNGTRPVVISARAEGYSTGRATLLLADDEIATLTLTLPGSLLEGATGAATLSLDRAPTFAAAVTLVSTNPALSAPATVTIPPGSTSVVFSLTGTEDLFLNGSRLATLTAQFANWTSATNTVGVLDNESTNLVLTLPAIFTEADGVRTNGGRVALHGVAVSNVVFTLQSSSPAELSLPASVTVLAGQTNVLFDVIVLDDTNTNGARSIAVTASAQGFAAAQSAVTLYDDDPAQLTFSHISSPQHAGRAFAVGLDAYDITGRLITNFGGSLALNAGSPTGAVAVLPPTTGPFTNGRWNGSVSIATPATFVRLSCPPLGFTSDPFQVESWPVRTNSFPAQQIVYSPLTKLIYGSVPSYAATNPNTITAFDPAGGTNVWSLPVGDIIRPGFYVYYRSGRLALADNGQHLFVAASNAANIQRLDVLNRSITGSFRLDGLSVADLKPLAGSSTALAVALAHNPLEPLALPGVAVYDNGVLRSNTASSAFELEPGPAATSFYGFPPNSGAGTYSLSSYAVTPSGLSLLDTTAGLLPFIGPFTELEQVRGLIYAPTGEVLDPTNRVVLAKLNPGGGRIAPDPSAGRIFIAGYTGTNYFIQAHDARTFLPLKQFLIPGGAGEIIGLVRYGTNGLAMLTYWDFLFLVETPSLFPGGTPADLRLAQDHSPELPLVSASLTYAIQVTNAGPADAFEATITDFLPTNAVILGAAVSQGTWTNEGGTLRAELGYFPSGSSATLTLTVRPTIAGPIFNRASVVANEDDTNLFNNVATNRADVLADIDQDGLGDTWELSNLGTLAALPSADPDNDGRSNLQEFLDGTDPLDPDNALRIVSISANSGTVSLVFFASRGVSYALESSASAKGPWGEIRTVAGQSVRVMLTEALGPGPVFYRLRRLP